MATHIRCYACSAFFPYGEPACPDCEAPRRTKNGYLRKAQLNDHLYAQAENAERQRKAEAGFRAGQQLGGPPPKWAKERAKQLISEL